MTSWQSQARVSYAPTVGHGPAITAFRSPARRPLVINASLYLRCLGAMAIVWFHLSSDPWRGWIAGPGLAVFGFLSFMQIGGQHGFRCAVRRRARHLLLPWSAWWCIYAAAELWRSHGQLPPGLQGDITIWQLLTWPSLHLWYLPFIFIAGVAVQAVRVSIAPLSAAFKVSLACVFGLVMLIILSYPVTLPSGAMQFWYALPSIGIGLAFGYGLNLPRPISLIAAIALAVGVTVACIPMWQSDMPVIANAYTVGTWLIVLCALPVPRHRPVMLLASMTLGLYLMHPLIILLLWKFLGVDTTPAAIFPLTLLIALFATWTMRKHRLLRCIV